MTSGCKENLNWEFLSYVIRFPWEQRPLVLDKIKGVEKNSRVVVLKNRKEADAFIEVMHRERGGKQ